MRHSAFTQLIMVTVTPQFGHSGLSAFGWPAGELSGREPRPGDGAVTSTVVERARLVRQRLRAFRGLGARIQWGVSGC
jgi:hypothetical protein